jgi:hypothetical protein
VSGLRRVALSVATTVVAALAFALAVAAAGSASTKLTHFTGLPPEGVKPSTPTTGRLLVGARIMVPLGKGASPFDPSIGKPVMHESKTWNMYADGRIIWQEWTRSGDASVVPDGARRRDTGYVQQRLTPQGVQLVLRETGETGPDFEVDRGHPIAGLVAYPGRWLPASAWANRQIKAFVPARYVVAIDWGRPDISKLPSPAGEVLSQYKPLLRHLCQVITTEKTRALLQAFVDAGISPWANHAYAQSVTQARGLGGRFHIHMRPATPDRVRC